MQKCRQVVKNFETLSACVCCLFAAKVHGLVQAGAVPPLVTGPHTPPPPTSLQHYNYPHLAELQKILHFPI